jgi:carbon-monoxide dehydrogenase large subunit
LVKLPQKGLRSNLTGSATFIEDLNVPNQVYIGFLRSPLAHATIREIDTSCVDRANDAVGVFTHADLQDLLVSKSWQEYPLAEREVVYQGHPVAAVVATKKSSLEDCLETINVTYEPLPAVSDPFSAMSSKGRWLSTASSNVVFERAYGAGRTEEAMKGSPHVIELRFHLPRWSPFPIEGRGIVIERTPDETVVYSSTQAPHLLSQFLFNSQAGSKPVRVIQAAVGGAFGGKMFPHPEDLVSYLVSTKLRRNVKWVPFPEEKLVTLTHRPDQTHEVQVGYDGSGRILAISDRALVDAGACLGGSGSAPLQQPGMEGKHGSTAIDQMATMITGPYDVRDVDVRVTVVATNKVPMGPARGSGGMVATFILERVLSQIARRHGLDQFSVRKANLISDSSSVHTNPFGMSIPQSRFLELLETARTSRMTARVMRRASRSEGPTLMGCGLSFYLAESAPPSAETVRLELMRDGRLLLFASVAPTGTGSERTLATIISRKLHFEKNMVEVRSGDTGTSHLGVGTTSSRSIVYAGSAALLACDLLVSRIKERLGGSSRSGSPSVTFVAGAFHLRYKDGSGRRLGFVDVARELRSGISVDATYKSETSTFSSGCHISLVRVDESTGSVKVLLHLTFDDFGTVLDRSAITSQLEGGVVQSIGEALMEDVEYDREGRLSTSYLIPSVLVAPKFSHTSMRLTTSQHLHGAKGAGEAGRIGSLPAIVNAVEDALSRTRRDVFLASLPIANYSIHSLFSRAP